MSTIISETIRGLRNRINSLSRVETPPNPSSTTDGRIVQEEQRQEVYDDPSRPRLVISQIPVEIRLCLMKAVDDIFTLRSLVYSSAAFLPVYNAHRQIILNSVFGREVDLRLMQEARFARATGRIDFRGDDVASQVAHYVRRYHHLRRSCEPGVLTPIVVDFEQAQRMTTLYSAIYALASDFCEQVSDSLGLTHGDRITFPSLNKEEQHRLKRAFFRYEIFSNLYRDRGLCLVEAKGASRPATYAPGLGKYGTNIVYRDDFDETMIDEATKARHFLQPFHPWEVEEFARIHDYCMRRWTQILSHFERHGRPLRDVGFEGNRCHLSMLGLEFLRRFLSLPPPGSSSSSEEEVDAFTARRRLIQINVHYEICNPKTVIDEYAYDISSSQTQSRDQYDDDEVNPGWTYDVDPQIKMTGAGIFWDRERLACLSRRLSKNGGAEGG